MGCDSTEGAIWLQMMGLPTKHIYCEGRGAETLKACVSSFRGRIGQIYVTCATPRLKNIRTIRVEVPDLVQALISAKTLRRMFAALQ